MLIEEIDNKKRLVRVITKGQLPKPVVMQCENIEDMLQKALKYKSPKIKSKKPDVVENSLNVAKDENVKTPDLILDIYSNIKSGESTPNNGADFRQSRKERLSNIFSKIDYKNVILKSPIDLLKMVVNRWNAYGKQNVDGSYFKVNAPISNLMLERHLAGDYTLGAYHLDKDNKVKWICIDLDAHEKGCISENEYTNKRCESINSLSQLCMFLDNLEIPYKVEASGSVDSYHVWIFLEPVDAVIARQFGNDIVKECGIKGVELFPKQKTLQTKKGFGNLVKIPLGYHQAKHNFSKIAINKHYEFQRTFENMTIGVLDISRYPLEPQYEKHISTEYTKVKEIRPCLRNAVEMRLIHKLGHYTRIAIVREYFYHGMTDPKELAELFSNQPDYDFEKSIHHVESIIDENMHPWKCETIRDKCIDVTNCRECKWKNKK